MASSEDTEITLGTGKLLVLFFGLVIVCALFFALGYSIGRKAEPSYAASSAAPTPPSQDAKKTSNGTNSAPATPMTFYKSVEQKDANPQLTPADAKSETASASGTNNPPPAAPASDSTTLPTAGYFVQVAAVTKQEDADALVDALKKKEYPAFVAPQPQSSTDKSSTDKSSTDKFFRVQLGPFTDIKEAEAMRTRLIADGYNPIVKK